MIAAKRYRPHDLFLEWLPYDTSRPQRPLSPGHELACAATKQLGMDNQIPCTYKAKVVAEVRDHLDRGAGDFPLCGKHVRARSIFVVPSAKL